MRTRGAARHLQGVALLQATLRDGLHADDERVLIARSARIGQQPALRVECQVDGVLCIPPHWKLQSQLREGAGDAAQVGDITW